MGMPNSSHAIVKKFMIYALLFSRAKASPEDLADTCSEKPSAHFVGPLTPFDTLKENYHVISNTENFTAVKLFWFGENHNDETHHLLQVDFVNRWGEKHDRLLFEGFFHDKTFACDKVCYFYDTNTKATLTSIDSNKCKIKFNYSPDLICQGWVDPSLLALAQEAVQRTTHRPSRFETAFQGWDKEIKSFTQNMKLLLDKPDQKKADRSAIIHYATTLHDQIITLQKLMQKIPLSQMPSFLSPVNVMQALKKFEKDKAVSSDVIISALQKHLIFFLEIKKIIWAERDKIIQAKLSREEYDKIVIKDPNQVLISTSNRFEYAKTNKQIIFAGARHLVPDTDNPFVEVLPNDPQFELREAIKDIPHAILIPKK